MIRAFALVAFLVFEFSFSAIAAEPIPGDVCSGLNRMTMSGGPETSGVRRMLRCDGTAWKQQMTFSSTGVIGIGTDAPSLDQGTLGLHIYNSGTSGPDIHLSNDNSGLHIEGWSGNYYLDTYENVNINIDTQDVDRFTVKGNGDVVVWNNLGIGTSTPGARLDINGYMRLSTNSAQPVACSSTYDGSIALTHVYTLCVCKGGSSAWVKAADGSTACSW